MLRPTLPRDLSAKTHHWRGIPFPFAVSFHCRVLVLKLGDSERKAELAILNQDFPFSGLPLMINSNACSFLLNTCVFPLLWVKFLRCFLLLETPRNPRTRDRTLVPSMLWIFSGINPGWTSTVLRFRRRRGRRKTSSSLFDSLCVVLLEDTDSAGVLCKREESTNDNEDNNSKLHAR